MDASKLSEPSEIQRLSKDETIALYKRHMMAQHERAETAEAKNAKLSALIVEQEAEYRKEKRAAEARCARLQQALEPARVFMEHFVPVEEALINGFDVDAWCALADEALAGPDGEES